MAHYDGSIKFDTSIDNRKFEGSINKLKTTAIKSMAVVGTAFTTAAGFAINLASDLQEVQNVVDVTFGDRAADIEAWAKNAASAFGLSELQAKQFNGTMGAMIKSMGLTDSAVLEMSTTLTGLAADFASFYNLEHQEAFDKIRAGISGETEPLKQLGINMSVANLEAFALSQGITKAYNAMSQAEQATLRYNYLLHAGADAQGDFARTSDSFANQLKIAKLNVTELGAEFGDMLLPIASQGLKELSGATTELRSAIAQPELKSAIEDTGELIITLIDGGIDLATAVLPPLISTLGFLAENIRLITSVAIGSVAAFKGYAIIQSVRAWFAAATPTLNAYTLAVTANSAAEARGITISALLTSTMSAQEIVVGVLTGKITLATAAHELWNRVKMADPTNLVIAAVIGLTAAIATLIITQNKEISVTQKIVKTNGEVRKSVEDLNNSRAEAYKAINENCKAEKTEAETAVFLKDRLYELEKQINSGALSDEEATERKSEFKSVASELEKLIPGITSALYDETGEINLQRQSVDALVTSYYDLAVAKAMATAYEEKFNKDAKDIIEAKETLDKAEKNRKNASAKLEKVSAITETRTRNGVTYEVPVYAGEVISLTEAKNSAESAYKEAKKSYDAIEKRREENFANFQKYSAEAKELTKKYTQAGGKVVKETETDKTEYVRTGGAQRVSATNSEYEERKRLLEHLHETGQLSEYEYYKKSEALRDEFLVKNSDEWFGATEEIYEYQQKFLEKEKELYKETYDDIFKYTSDKIDAVIEKQEAYSNKLKSHRKIAGKQTIILNEKHKPDIVYYRLTDFTKDIEYLKNYNDLLSSFKAKVLKSGISDKAADSFFSELLNYDIDEGIGVLNALLKTSDAELNKYLKAYEERQTFADMAAASLYKSDMDTAVDESVVYMKEKLKEAGFEIPDTFFDAGVDAASKFGEAFSQEIDVELGKIKQKIESFKTKIKVDVDVSVDKASHGTTIYKYYGNNTYQLGSSGETTQQRLEAIRHDEEFRRLSGEGD